MKDKKELLKKIINELNIKSDFVKTISKKYNKSFRYILQHWFQKKWSIPEDIIDDIIEKAQSELLIQIETKTKILVDTGYIKIKRK